MVYRPIRTETETHITEFESLHFLEPISPSHTISRPYLSLEVLNGGLGSEVEHVGGLEAADEELHLGRKTLGRFENRCFESRASTGKGRILTSHLFS